MTTDERIIAAYQSGEFVDDILLRFRISEEALYRILRAHGVPNKAAPLWTDAEDQFLTEHYLTMSDGELGDALGRSSVGVSGRRRVLRLLRPHAKTGRIVVMPGHSRTRRKQPEKRVRPVEFEPVEDMRAPFVSPTLSQIMGRPVYAQRNALGVALIQIDPTARSSLSLPGAV